MGRGVDARLDVGGGGGGLGQLVGLVVVQRLGGLEGREVVCFDLEDRVRQVIQLEMKARTSKRSAQARASEESRRDPEESRVSLPIPRVRKG